MSARRAAPKRRADHRNPRATRTAPKRRAARPRSGRIALVGLAGSVTVAALLAGIGVLPLDQVEQPAAAEGHVAGAPGVPDQFVQANAATAPADLLEQAARQERATEAEKRRASTHAERARAATDLPAKSGEGRRAVFDMSAQRVWIVGSGDRVERTYLVSGSLLDNLSPGTYSVYSRSRNAIGIDNSGEMEYFVRFTRGKNAAIGFHSIPTKDGKPLQTRAQLGTPQSHGCIRQALPDAIAMWEFAQIGTTVVVTA